MEKANGFTPKEHDQYNPLKNILGFVFSNQSYKVRAFYFLQSLAK